VTIAKRLFTTYGSDNILNDTIKREATMSNETIHIHLEVSVPEANRAGFVTLMNELVDRTSKEAGTLVYEWYEVGDSGKWHILARYADAENGDLHVKRFAEN